MKLRGIKVSKTSKETLILYSNKSFTKGKIIDVHNIIDNYTKVIVFEGHWNIRLLDLVNVLKLIKDTELLVQIKTDLSFSEFKIELGKVCYNKVNNINDSEYDEPMMELMGAVLLDFYLGNKIYHIETVENGKNIINEIRPPKEELENVKEK